MKENQRIKVTKKMLKDAVLELLKEKDLDAITVTELCARAGVNRTTFYRYYRLPVDVLEELEQEFIEDMHTTLANVKTAADVKEYLKKICESCYDKTSALSFFMRYDFQTDHALMLRELYNSGRKAFYSKSSADEYSKILGTYFAGGSYFILRVWAEGGIERTPEEMASLLWELMTGDYSHLPDSLK